MKNHITLLYIVPIFCWLSLLPAIGQSQDSASLYQKAFSFPDRFFSSVNKKSEKVQQHLLTSTEKYLDNLSKQERRLQRKLAKKDPTAAKEIFGDVNHRYDSLKNALINNPLKLQNAYASHLDSMTTALRFFQNSKALNQSPEMQAKLASVFKGYDGVQGKLNQTNYIENQLKERQKYLKDKLKNYGLGKEIKKYQEKVYYYRAQVDEYKQVFDNPQKLESKLLQAANAIPSFRQFFNKNSQLASLFRLPGNDALSMTGADGLQTRDMIMQQLEQKLGTGPNLQQAVSNGMSAAKTDLNNTKDKLKQLGSSGSDMDMPNFKPNGEKSKSFLKRVELGTNFQSVKSNAFFPVSTDIGLSLGYKFTPKSIAGIGASYRMGWGRNIRHIAVTHEGVGLRSFADLKLKGSFWISGGGEMNYRSRFDHFEALKNYKAWQTSALAGLSKKYKAGNKLKGNIQIMYDFLYRKQVPLAQPVVCRVGYSF